MTDTQVSSVTVRCRRGYANAPCGKRSCAICAVRRRKDWRWVFQQNLASLGDSRILMCTVTAPGSDVLPFDSRLCKVKGNHVCSGKIGCRVNPLVVEDWRCDMERRWSKFTDAARIRTKRAVGGSGNLMLAGAWELQARGVPHVHIVVPDGTRGRFFVDSLKVLAPGYGFGFVDSLLEPRHPLVAAAYLAKYMTKYGQDEEKVSVLLPAREFFVSRSLSQETGATIRTCMAVRRLWAVEQGYASFEKVVFKMSEREFAFALKFFKGDLGLGSEELEVMSVLGGMV